MSMVPAARAQLPSPGFTVGERFPGHEFAPVDEGEARTLAAFRGQKVLLHIFASW